MENTHKIVFKRPTVVSTREQRVYKRNNSDVNKIHQKIKLFEVLGL